MFSTAGSGGTAKVPIRFHVPPHEDNVAVEWLVDADGGKSWRLQFPLKGAEERWLVSWEMTYDIPIGPWKMAAVVHGKSKPRGWARIKGEVR